MKQNRRSWKPHMSISYEDLMKEVRKKNIYIAISIMTAVFLSLAALVICN